MAVTVKIDCFSDDYRKNDYRKSANSKKVASIYVNFGVYIIPELR